MFKLETILSRNLLLPESDLKGKILTGISLSKQAILNRTPADVNTNSDAPLFCIIPVFHSFKNKRSW